MASFIAWYGKKRSRLAEHERAFFEVVRSNASVAQVADAAEMIRAAQIRALKEKRQKFAPSEKNTPVLAEIEQAISLWAKLPNDAIIDGYRDPARQRKMSSAVRRASK